jgi:hypothetical protein
MTVQFYILPTLTLFGDPCLPLFLTVAATTVANELLHQGLQEAVETLPRSYVASTAVASTAVTEWWSVMMRVYTLKALDSCYYIGTYFGWGGK